MFALGVIWFSFALFFLPHLHADVLKENYITFITDAAEAELIIDFESDNLGKYVSLDANNNGITSWKEIKSKKKEIVNYVLPHIRISTDNNYCKKVITSFETNRRGHQTYIKLKIRLSCANPEKRVKVFYDLFFDEDREQKAFFSIKKEGDSFPVILSPHSREAVLELENTSSFINFTKFVSEGIWHIWLGFDHILFLLMLLIPSVIIYEKKKIITRVPLKIIVVNTLKVVTAFSIAHSITLVLSVLDAVSLNTQLIEVFIALSVLFTALNNIFLATSGKLWMLSFGFGLLHGFGFARVLKEMLLNNQELVSSLLGFNLGVEVGQIALVIIIVPFIYVTRNTWFYRYIILYGVSLLTAAVASIWTYERIYNLSILPV